jgi:hypothetical protein
MTRSPSSRGRDRRRRTRDERPAPAARTSTVIITNLIKLVAIGIAINEMVIRPTARESVVAFCALCLIGSQAAEEIIIHAIDRVFGKDD